VRRFICADASISDRGRGIMQVDVVRDLGEQAVQLVGLVMERLPLPGC
jgi:hypothetical protein